MSPTFTDLCGESDSITQQTNDILYKINKIEKEELEQLEGYLMLREQQQSLKKKHDELFKKLQYLSDKYNNKLPRRLKDALKKFQKPSKNKNDVHYKNESTTTIDEINRNYLQSRLDCSNKLMQVKRELFKCIEEQNVVDQNKESLKKKKQKLQLEKQSLLGLKQKLEQKQNDLMLTGFLGK
nr:7662_t:CDS:2 [Entrophospora candida]